MSNFKVGQKVVCVGVSNQCICTKKNLAHPEKGEVVTISAISEFYSGWLVFEEFDENYEYEPWNFEPLVMDYDFVNEVIKQVTPKKLPTKVETSIIDGRVEVISSKITPKRWT